MNKKYSIGMLIGMLLFVYALCIAYQMSYNYALEKQAKEKLAQENALLTEGVAYKEDGYIITAEDGYVIVYYSDLKNVYEYTTIELELLPQDVQKELTKGIYVEEIKDVYGFLENYSS